MKVVLRNPHREVDVAGPMSVAKLLNRLELNREAVLVIRNATLVPNDAVLDDGDTVEIRPVISGGQTADVADPPRSPRSVRDRRTGR